VDMAECGAALHATKTRRAVETTADLAMHELLIDECLLVHHG
jgi:hypothetical protein